MPWEREQLAGPDAGTCESGSRRPAGELMVILPPFGRITIVAEGMSRPRLARNETQSRFFSAAGVQPRINPVSTDM